MARWGVGHLRARLVLAFLGVALAAEVAFAAMTLVAERSDVADLASAQQPGVTAAVVSALDDAYGANGGWAGADFAPASAIAGPAGAGLEVRNADGAVLLRAGATSLLREPGAVHVERVLRARGRTVGAARLAFRSSGLTPADERLRSELAKAVIVAAALAAAVAVSVALIAARGLARPIHRLAAAATALGAGIRGVRVGPSRGPVELAHLARAFDSMAASLERQEELRQAMAADVAHELRTPLAILQAETELLVEGTTEPTAEALMSLHDEALRLGRMVEDLQTLASADAAGLRLERSRVDLADVTASAIDALEGRVATAGVTLDRELTTAEVWADPSRLHQVVVNLVGNALKFTPAGGTVRVSVTATGEVALLAVADSGPGVPPEERERVFERFFRGAAGRRSGGSGIGLAVVKDLVEAHGGRVSVGSADEGGARFAVTLPLAGRSAPGVSVTDEA